MGWGHDWARNVDPSQCDLRSQIKDGTLQWPWGHCWARFCSWVVERTFAWLNRNRRLAKDFEATIQSAVTWLYIASVKLMTRRLAAA